MTQTHDKDETKSSHLDVDRLLSVLMDDLLDPDATKPPRVESASRTTTSAIALEHQNRRAGQPTSAAKVPDRARELFTMDTAEIGKALFGSDIDQTASAKPVSINETTELVPVQPPFVAETVTDETTLFQTMTEREKRMHFEDKWLAEQRIRLHMEKMVLEEQARRLMLEERLAHEQGARLSLERRIEALEKQLEQAKSKVDTLIQQVNAEQSRRAQAVQHLKTLEDHLSR